MSNFDGVIHFSGSEVVNERAFCSNQPAIPEILAGLLNEGYVYLREHANLIAARSWYGAAATDIDDASPVLITRVNEAYLPPHATALIVAVRHGSEESDPSRGRHFVRIVGGTGNYDSALVEGQSTNAVVPLAAGIPLVLDAYVYMPITDALLTAVTAVRTALTVELHGHGVLETGNGAANYRPMSADFYWVSEY
jgi:hypothetical protein